MNPTKMRYVLLITFSTYKVKALQILFNSFIFLFSSVHLFDIGQLECQFFDRFSPPSSSYGLKILRYFPGNKNLIYTFCWEKDDNKSFLFNKLMSLRLFISVYGFTAAYRHVICLENGFFSSFIYEFFPFYGLLHRN